MRSGSADDRTRPAVDDRRPPETARTACRARARAVATSSAPADEPGTGGPVGAGLGPEHHVGIEHRDQRLEVAVARRGEERVDDLALLVRGCAASGSGAPRTRRRARLASWRVAATLRSTIGAISSNGTPNMSCSTNASRSAGDSVSSTTSSASPTESASSASCSGSPRVARTCTIGSAGQPSTSSSRRAWRARSMSRQIRLTTVVSQPRMFSTSAVSERFSRSHASWTASSASAASRASAAPPPAGESRFCSNCSCLPVACVHRSHPLVGVRHMGDEPERPM